MPSHARRVQGIGGQESLCKRGPSLTGRGIGLFFAGDAAVELLRPHDRDQVQLSVWTGVVSLEPLGVFHQVVGVEDEANKSLAVGMPRVVPNIVVELPVNSPLLRPVRVRLGVLNGDFA